MKEFTIKIPMTGYVELILEAEDEDSAIDKAFEVATLDNVEEWELHHKVTQGNVCYAILHEIEVYEE